MRFVGIVQVDTPGNYVRVVEGCCAGGASEGCAEGYDAGQGLLRVGAWWLTRPLTVSTVHPRLESFRNLRGYLLGKCAHPNKHMCNGKFPVMKRLKNGLRLR